MFSFLFRHKWYVIIILIMIFVSPLITSWMNFYLQDIFNAATTGGSNILLIRMLTIGFLVWMLKRFVEYTSSLLKAKFLCNVKQDVKHDMFTSIFKQDVSEVLNKAKSGEYISSFTNDINIIEQRYFSNIVSLISNLISTIILGFSFITLNRIIANFIFIFAILTLFIPMIFSKLLNIKNYTYSKELSHFTQKLKEFFTAYTTIKNYSVESKIIERFSNTNKNTENSKFESDYVLTLANNVSSLLSWFMQFIAIGVGLILVVNGNVMIGTVIAAQSFASDLASPLQEILFNINSIRSVKDIISKIKSYTHDVTINNNTERKVLENKGAELAFSNVNLRIGNTQVINRFSYVFKKGKKYLIIGKNGSGKSSIFKILKRYIGNADGEIKINGVPLSSINNESLSEYVSYLNENVSMFTSSVMENITLYQTFKEIDVERAVEYAKVNVELERMIKDDAINLSSGEQRRIEIARSILRTSPILIFDEVVSTLDIETAYEIENMVLQYDNTIIFISHNFSGKLIKKYDEILVMDNGNLIAHGTYDELINNCDYFKKICEIKFGG